MTKPLTDALHHLKVVWWMLAVMALLMVMILFTADLYIALYGEQMTDVENLFVNIIVMYSFAVAMYQLVIMVFITKAKIKIKGQLNNS